MDLNKFYNNILLSLYSVILIGYDCFSSQCAYWINVELYYLDSLVDFIQDAYKTHTEVIGKRKGMKER